MQAIRIPVLVAVAVLLGGCSYVRSSKRMDLAPFAETTISLATDIEDGLNDTTRAIHLRPFWNDPVLAEHRKEWEKVRALLRGVVAYSVELTTLGNSTLPGPERCRELASFLDPLAKPVITYRNVELRITEERLAEIIEEIRGKRELLEGISAAQPLVDEVARIADEIFDEVQVSLDDTAHHLMDRIDEENARVASFDEALIDAQYRIFEEISFLGLYRRGDDEALRKLFEYEPQLRALVKDPAAPTQDEIQAIEDRLVYMLEVGKDWKKLIRPDMDDYHAQQLALANLYTDANRQLRRARVTMIIWARAHRNLASGITDPAKIDLFDVTKKAVKTAL